MAAPRARPLVIVVGGGNAGICAALAARRSGAEVVVLEKAAAVFRGGNSRHTRDIRYAHEAPDAFSTGAYGREEFLDDLAAVSAGADPALARRLVDDSSSLPAWMSEHGVRWQQSLHGALHLARTNAFFLGGGRALLNSYYDTAQRLGVDVRYGAHVVRLAFDGGREARCVGVTFRVGGTERTVAPDALVLAAGGSEANLALLRSAWGSAADNFIVRGSPANDGAVLGMMLDAGAAPVGDQTRFHAVAVDARSPRFDGGIVTRVDAVPYGIVVNAAGCRFYDEGETYWPKRYAIWGRLIAEQPGQQAWVVFDAAARQLFIPPLYPPLVAATLAELADLCGLPREPFLSSVATFNAATDRATAFDPESLDGLATRGLAPAKSNWARPIERPPFAAYPLRPGITFTYAGLRVDASTRVVRRSGDAFRNVYAAGELMAGNVLTDGYLAGIGLTIGTVFGRIAGQEAAAHATRSAH